MENEKKHFLPSPVLLVTDRKCSRLPLPAAVTKSVQAGARWIRVREPDLSLSAYVTLCRILMDDVSDSRVTWSVRPQAWSMLRTLYPECRLSVHLTRSDSAWQASDVSVLCGRSIGSLNDLDRNSESSDYLLLAPVFTSTCKPDVKPIGEEILSTICRLSKVPVLALGGISVQMLEACYSSGVAGVAVRSKVFDSDNPDEQFSAILNGWRSLAPD